MNEEELYMIIVAITREARKWLYIPKNIYTEFKLLISYLNENDIDVTPVNDKYGLGSENIGIKTSIVGGRPEGRLSRGFGWREDAGPESQLRLSPE